MSDAELTGFPPSLGNNKCYDCGADKRDLSAEPGYCPECSNEDVLDLQRWAGLIKETFPMDGQEYQILSECVDKSMTKNPTLSGRL
jgi:hypothetical protein